MSAAASTAASSCEDPETYVHGAAPPRLWSRAFIDLLVAEALFGFSYAQFVLLPKLLTVGYGATAGQIGFVMGAFGVASLLIVGALGLWVGWPRDLQAQASAADAAPSVVWQPWSPETVGRLREEGRIVYVDFTARWCATCQTNKKLVFGSDEVLRYFAEKKIATLRADWTKQDPRITEELARYHRSAVPFNVVWVPGRDAPVILPELLTAGTVLDAIRNAETAPDAARVTAR